MYYGSARRSRQGVYQPQLSSKAIFWYVNIYTILGESVTDGILDTNGAPRTVINSKGRRRRPGTKTLAQVLRCNDEEFVDFVAKCLVWDPERRMKPQTALRHPFVTAGKRARPAMNGPKSTPSSSTLGARSKQLTETPKKSLISAPTPLTARSSRTAATTNGVPISPNTSFTQSVASGSSQTSRSYRASQSQSLSFNSSRTLSGYAVSPTFS